MAGHLAAEKAFRAGGSELDIHLAFLGASRQSEADLPYGNIVALNENAATLHYQLQLPDAPPQRHSLLIDAGATCRGYASDITRTYAANPGLFASLIEGMHRLQQELCARVAPGVDWRELHLAAHLLVSQLAARCRRAAHFRRGCGRHGHFIDVPAARAGAPAGTAGA